MTLPYTAFAIELRQDRAAVQAGLSLSWRNGARVKRYRLQRERVVIG